MLRAAICFASIALLSAAPSTVDVKRIDALTRSATLLVGLGLTGGMMRRRGGKVGYAAA